MSLSKTAFVWCLWLGLLELSYGATIRHYNFDVEYMIKKPDCLEHVVMGINGQFPGPTISAQVGDTLAIALTNKLSTEGTVTCGICSSNLKHAPLKLMVEATERKLRDKKIYARKRAFRS